MNGNEAALAQLTARVRAEFIEMPGLNGPAHRLARLLGMQLEDFDAVASALVASGFLMRRENGSYVKVDGAGRRDKP